MPHKNLKRAREADPALDAFVLRATAGNNARGQVLRRERLRIAKQRAEANDFDLISGLVPRNLPGDMRDDIIQSIFLALLEGSLRRDEVAGRVRQFVTLYNAEARKQGVGQYGMRSLDAPLFADSSASLGDTITHGLWD